jgi:hypothetical protein
MEIQRKDLELWNEICFIINGHKEKSTSEHNFQIEAENIFEKLGWSRYKGEIVSQQAIPVGSARSLKPGIIIKFHSKNILVAELKCPGVDFCDRNSQQLVSYMLQLKLKYGILFGETLQLYYDDPADNEKPEKVFEVKFIHNNESGTEFINLIKKANFDEDVLAEFIQNCLKMQHNKKTTDEIIKQLTSVDEENQVIELLRENLQTKYDKEIVDLVIERISINISSQVIHPCANEISATPQSQIQEEGPKAIRRIPRWAKNPSQINHKILRAFLKLQAENGSVTVLALRQRCSDINFPSHYASMKTDHGNSHGKVFEESNGYVTIWDVVQPTIEKYRKYFE